MNADRAKSQDRIFADMHRELRAWNPKIPESPDRLDPILRLLLHSRELSRIDQRVSNLWERATSSLIRSLNPECKRWPVPAYTVMQCDISDPVVEIDQHTRFFYREEREGGQTFLFSPLGGEKLVGAAVKHIYIRAGDRAVDISPGAEKTRESSVTDPALATLSPQQVYLAVEFQGRPADLAGAVIFLQGEKTVLRQLRWAYWYPSAASGQFYEDSGFCPGLTSTIEDVVASDGSADDWGGLRTGASLFGLLQDSFVVIPQAFAHTLEIGPPNPGLVDLLNRNQLPLPPEDNQLYWIRADLPTGGDKSNLAGRLGIYFDSCIVTNRNELTLFKHTGGNRLVEIEIPESIDSILEVCAVVDSAGRSYLPRHKLYSDQSARTYVLEERKDRLALWLDFSSEQDLPPDSITVSYAVTAGTDANGISADKICELYESHPGISGGRNVMPTTGAIPAKSEQQIVDEVAGRLRGRDRALTFEELARWARSFDPRIKVTSCQNGIERTPAGVRRCIVVTLTIDRDQFCSEDEIGLLRTRLDSFLKSRAPVNTHFQVETPE